MSHVIVIVPDDVDLTAALMWYSSNPPKQVDILTERELAEAAGIKPFSAEMVSTALAKGGEPLVVDDLATMLKDHVAELVLEYSPQEQHLAEKWRLPVAGE